MVDDTLRFIANNQKMIEKMAQSESLRQITQNWLQ